VGGGALELVGAVVGEEGVHGGRPVVGAWERRRFLGRRGGLLVTLRAPSVCCAFWIWSFGRRPFLCLLRHALLYCVFILLAFYENKIS
jgi:hypothetical protein